MLFFVAVAYVFLACAHGLSATAEGPNVRFVLQDVRGLLKKKSGLPLDVRGKADELERYYARKDSKVLWMTSERNRELISVLRGLTANGISDMDAALRRVEMRQQALNSEDTSLLALVELTFSATFIEAIQNLRLGQIHLYRDKLHPRTLERFIYTDRVFALVAEGQPLNAILMRLEPQTPDYQAIRNKLMEYVAIQKRGGWPGLRPGPDLKEGSAGPRVADLRQRLEASGYMAAASGTNDFFDATLSQAVRQFQKQHNIPPTGVVNRSTLFSLNIPARDRVAQLRANLERWRWFEDIPDGEHWVINTNTARLVLRKADGTQRKFSLRVDSACEQVPAFDSMIDHIDVAPTYTFPGNLSSRYILPVLQSTPNTVDSSLVVYADDTLSGVGSVDWKSYSETNFPFVVSQNPGDKNLLGLFRLPLKHDRSVSIHGRPSTDPKLPVPRKLWPACVALSGSTDIKAELLAGLGVSIPDEVFEAKPVVRRRVELPSPIPVIFHYGTVWLDPAVGLVFGADPLGLDASLARKLSNNASS
jgi:murein L,D-transpeptidase YcbB/YkuD